MPESASPVAEAPPKTPPALPTKKSMSASTLAEKMVTIYGPAGVGKSTLASQWADGQGFFFNCSGELGDFEIYQQSITNFSQFREYAWALAEEVAKKKDKSIFKCAIIDTLDALGRYCSESVRAKLQIGHESDLDYGKGWDELRAMFALNMSKLAALSNFGLVIVAHADERTVKTRSAEYDKWQIRGTKAAREVCQDMSDLVLFVNFTEDDEQRVICTKPSRHWDAKERGTSPRLPAQIVWPYGENGWDIIKTAYDEGAK